MIIIEKTVTWLLIIVAKFFTGVRPVWQGSKPVHRQRVYYANHRSHGDSVLLWITLPAHLRHLTRPVAGADYWQKNALRRFIAHRVFRCVMIQRERHETTDNPIAPMLDALHHGDSLILFPEGTRNLGEGLLPFKSGIYYLAKEFSDIEFIPVWIENLGRVMPKGTKIPVPLLCTLTFGEGLYLQQEENKELFLARLEQSLLALQPPGESNL